MGISKIVLFCRSGYIAKLNKTSWHGCLAKHKKGIYIFELKVDDPVDRAFAQIREKNYAAPYLADPRPIWLIGLSFDSKTRHLIDCAAVCQKGQVPV